MDKKMDHSATVQRVPAPRLYTIITARRPWPVRNSGKIKSATLLMLPVCLFSKPRKAQNINGRHYNGKI